MEKDFDKWNNLKKKIEDSEQGELYPSNWDIWWTNIWLNLWTESCGKWDNFRRPVLILKKLSLENFIVIPLTSQEKSWTWFCEYELNWETNYVMLYQIKMIYKSRLERKIWKIEAENFLKIKKRLKLLLNL